MFSSFQCTLIAFLGGIILLPSIFLNFVLWLDWNDPKYYLRAQSLRLWFLKGGKNYVMDNIESFLSFIKYVQVSNIRKKLTDCCNINNTRVKFYCCLFPQHLNCHYKIKNIKTQTKTQKRCYFNQRYDVKPMLTSVISFWVSL